MATTPTYEIDYEDKRLTGVEDEKNQRLTAEETTYGSMIDNTDQFYQAQIDASKDWANQQSQIQQEQTDFTIEQIEQQKEQAEKDYTKEQAGAYVDWQKQSNQYGVNAEKMASAGLAGTGFSESSQVSMYNTYQNRVSTARESFNKAVLNYNNAIKDARLQNNAALAEIAANALQQQLELSLQGFQYKNQLISELSDKKMQIESLYNDKWKTQLDVMNKEIDRTWQADQNKIEREWQAEQSEIERGWKEKEAQLDRNFQSTQAQIERKFKEAQAELDRKHDFAVIKANTQAEKERADHEHKLALDKLAKQQAYEMAQIAQKHANDKALMEKEQQLQFNKTQQQGQQKKGVQVLTTPNNNVITKNKNAFNGSTYKEAAAYLKSKGAVNGAMTESEWSRRKNSYSMTGQGAEEVKRFASYKDYIQAYVQYKTSG
jgi:DNA repair exonuclease SbcCD ATPase subunit